MKPTTAAYAAFFTLAILHSGIANADDTLTCRMGPVVSIHIKKIDCPLTKYKEKYPWGAVAHNSNTNQYIFGCFRKFDENIIEIQWAQGDTSGIPANCFLLGKPQEFKGEF
jgi:hypothetical protein